MKYIALFLLAAITSASALTVGDIRSSVCTIVGPPSTFSNVDVPRLAGSPDEMMALLNGITNPQAVGFGPHLTVDSSTGVRLLKVGITTAQVSDISAFGASMVAQSSAATVKSLMGMATIASTGAFADLTGAPTTLAGYGITDPVAFTSGSYANPAWITQLAYSKLTGAPSIPAAQVNSDWSSASGLAQILNKPVLGTAAAQNSSAFDASGAAATSQAYAIQRSNHTGTQSVGTITGLATVATSGQYSDLSGSPSIPAAQVNSDWNSSSGASQILNKPSLGTAALQNSTTFATAAQGILAASALQSFTESDPIAGAALTTHSNLTTGAHGGIVASGDSRLTDSRTPTAHASTHATGGTDPITAASITAEPAVTPGTTGQYWRGDKTWQTLSIPAAQVQSDWNAVSGIGVILNKPSLGTAASQNSTAFATSSQGTKADSAVQTGTAPLSVTGTAVSIIPATASVPGSMSAADKLKIDGIQTTRVQTDANGNYTWTYPTAYAGGVVPRIEVVVETASGTADVVNAQVNGTPTNTVAIIKVNRTQQSAVALLGLTILSVPGSVGAQWIHITSRAP